MIESLSINTPDDGDFVIDDLTIEVGGKAEDTSPVNHLIAADDIEFGVGGKIDLVIPL